MTIEQKAREIAASVCRYPSEPSHHCLEEAAQRGIILERERISNWLIELSQRAADAMRALHEQKAIDRAMTERWEALISHYESLAEAIRSQP